MRYVSLETRETDMTPVSSGVEFVLATSVGHTTKSVFSVYAQSVEFVDLSANWSSSA